MIMTIIYVLVGIIALCGVIGAYRFFAVINICGEHLADDYYDNYFERNQEGLSDKDIEFINNHEYCPKKENNDA